MRWIHSTLFLLFFGVQLKVRVNPQNANRKGLKDLKEITSDSLRSSRSSWFDFRAKPFGNRILTGLS